MYAETSEGFTYFRSALYRCGVLYDPFFLCVLPRSALTPNVSRISQDSPCSVKSVSPASSGSSSGFVDAEAPRASFLPRNLLTMFDEALEQ